MSNDFNQKGAEFLRVEVETGLTFANIAVGEEQGSEERVRNQANALKAYQTVLRLRDRVENPDEATNRAIQNGLDQLRSVLEKLGEKLG
jgi:hypothetical protein